MAAFYAEPAERAAAAKARPAVRALAASLGVTIDARLDGAWHELVITAPPRSIFAAEGLHEFIVANAGPITDGLWPRALARLSADTVAPCTDDACEWCRDDDTVDDGDDALAEDYPGQRITGPDFDTRDREGRDAWIIRCRVSGGVTGTRESILKANGDVARFATEAEARAEADRLTASANGPHATARFVYWPDVEGGR